MESCNGRFIRTAMNGLRLMSSWSRLAKLYPRGVVGDKIRLIEGYRGDQVIRCGVLGSSKFIGTFTVDHIEARNSWAKRYVDSILEPAGLRNKLVSYGEEFSQGRDSYMVPSIFLKNNKVEFLTVDEVGVSDGCHFYLRIDKKERSLTCDVSWPVIELEDVKYDGSFLLGNQIDTNKSLQATLDLGESKLSMTEYLRAQEESNFDHVNNRLIAKLQSRDTIIEDLKAAVIKHIRSSDPDIESIEKEDQKLDSAYLAVDQWAEDAHRQLQEQIIPSFIHFAKTQLSLWKLYTHSESKLKLRFMECCMLPLYNVQVIEGKSEVLETNIRNEFGQVGHNEPLSPLVPVNDIQKIGKIQKDINKAIYHEFFSLQLPMMLVALLGVVSEQFSGFYMGSVAALGIVLGFSRTMTKWKKILNTYTDHITRIIRDRVEMRRIELKRRAQRFHDQKNSTLINKRDAYRSVIGRQY
ncbi:hypothetical protein RNJ44_02268 [Nakaseomyces bracarensis]|uniref:Mmc1 C-terminal domain-containing protein n=1 Tax=Nakaseomyces bracarensis TaxID=273131 RepID=A0ABR4NN61_9SACH